MHLTLRMQLTLAFLAQAVLLAGVGLFSINQLNIVHHASTDIADNRLPATLYLGRIDVTLYPRETGRRADLT